MPPYVQPHPTAGEKYGSAMWDEIFGSFFGRYGLSGYGYDLHGAGGSHPAGVPRSDDEDDDGDDDNNDE